MSLLRSPMLPSHSHLDNLHYAYPTLSPKFSASPSFLSASTRSLPWIYVPPVPNLELHSAAAEDNVGLVHYALTHGQPINSVLHGVQPIHAAAAGGSVSAMRMLIERGADVNAPRLPRRYSNEKKRGAPALGAAAANGHVNIVRILLTCGAAPDKEDKLGQTPESLAEHNGHEDVLRAINAYRHMKSDDEYASSSPLSPSSSFTSFGRAGPSSERMLSSPDILAEIIPEEFEGEEDPEWQVGGSRKGKERALSFASLRNANAGNTDANGAPLRMKRSLGGLGGLLRARASRSNSVTSPPPPPIVISSPNRTESPQLPEMLPISSVSLNDEMSPGNLATLDEALELAARSSPTPRPEDIPIPESTVMSGASTPGGMYRGFNGLTPPTATSSQSPTPRAETPNGSVPDLGLPAKTPSPAETPMSDEASIRFGAMAAMAYLAQTDADHTPRPASPALSASDLPPLPPSLPETPSQTTLQQTGAPISRVTSQSSVDSNELSRVGSAVSAGSSKSAGLGIQNGGPASPVASKRERHSSQTSRRPSLPSILEKAAHPGAAFRAAIRRDHNSPETSPKQETDHRGMFRGRLRSNESALSSNSSDGGAMQNASNAAKRYMSKHSIVSLFRRSNSPPSRSPSPPRRDANAKPIDIDELDAGIERLQRASLELDRRDGRSRSNSAEMNEEGESRSLYDEPDELEAPVRDVPKSAPVSKTRFFEDLSPNPPPLVIPRTSPPRVEPRTPGGRRARARTGSEVIAPSPLANEWARDRDSDSDSAAQTRPPRRANSDQRAAPSPLRTNPSSPAASGAFSRPRSATSPTNGTAGFKVITGSKVSPLDWEDGVDLRKSVAVSEVIRRESEKERRRREQDGEGSRGSESPVGEEEYFDARGDSPLQTPNGELANESNEALKSPIDIDDNAEAAAAVRESEQSPEGDSTEKETEKEDEIEQTTPTADNISEPTYEIPKESPNLTGRFRGHSFGSMTSTSSRISTPPGSSLRISSIVSDDSSQRYPMSGSRSPESKPLSPTHTSDGRPRGISVSTVSSGVSGMGFQSVSTPSTSLTPPSALSITLGGTFPPVPENAVAYTHPVPRRKVSSRAEAEALLQQNEDDILQLAQLPPSLDSSRSLAAQLAAYGESHAMQQEFADRERRLRRAARRLGSTGTEDSSDGASFVSARSSARSGLSSGTSSNVIMSESSLVRSLAVLRAVSNPADVLMNAEAPINNIYDKRAAAYRERLSALTTAPSIPSGHKPRNRSRHRTVSDIANADNSLHSTTSGESDGDLSASAPGRPRTKKRSKAPGTFTAPSSFATSPLAQPSSFGHPSSLRGSMPPPNADVMSMRYTGLGGSQGTYPGGRNYSASISSSLPLGARPTTQAYAGGRGAPPYVSVFSNRFTGIHDGGDSDDEQETVGGRMYTMIENDWRGGHVVADAEAFKRGKWAAIKGSIGRVGRK